MTDTNLLKFENEGRFDEEKKLWLNDVMKKLKKEESE